MKPDDNQGQPVGETGNDVPAGSAPIGRERRAYERFPVNLRARVNSEGSVARDCLVRDFCLGGMYLAFEPLTDESKVAHLCSPAKDEQVSVECSVPVAGGYKTLTFNAHVVRKPRDGLALRFLNPDLRALQILLDHATSLCKQEDTATQSSLSSARFNGKSAQEIIQSCDHMVNRAAASLVARFHEDVVDYLFEVSKTALDITEQNAYFDALKVLNNVKDQLRKQFLESVEAQLASYSPDVPAFVDSETSTANVSSLSIVDDEVFDDWLADTATVDSVESRNKEVLTEIEKRLSLLYDADIRRVNNPYGPALFSRLFHDALKPLDLRHKVNLACYKVFRNVLLECLDNVYSKINQYFIDNDVMPVIQYSTPKPAQEDQEEEQEEAQSAAPARKAEQEVVPAKAAVEEAPVSQAADNPTAQASDVLPPSGQDLYQLVGELKTLQQQLSQRLGKDTAEGLVGRTIPVAAVNAGMGLEAGDGQASAGDDFSREEIQAALDLVEPALHDVADTNEIRDFKAEVLKVLGARAGATGKHLGVRESRIIDVASNIFHWMSTDMKVSEKIRNWIAQLELPVIKIAVDDDALFTDRSHLVRQVINKVAQLEMLVDESEKMDQPAVKKALDWIVTLVNEEFDGSTEVFARALHQLDILLNVQDKSYNANLQKLVAHFQQEEEALSNSDKVCIVQPQVVWDDVSEEEQALWIKRADRLQEGDWLVFGAGTDEAKRLRIAWKAQKTQRVVLANVLGVKECVLHVHELANDLRTGSTVVLDGVNEPAMDRAQYAMLEDLHQQLLFQSTHDQLTGLISRREFENHLNDLVSLAKENKSRHALCFLDLDQFNIINNACGYEGGDQLLKEISALLGDQLEDDWILARLGSDEFGLLLKDCVLDDALDFTEELMEVVQDYRLQWDNKRLSIGFSMGLVPISHRSEAANELMQAAESSCGVAKEMGGNRIQLYNASHSGLSQRRKAMKWAAEIDRILDEDTLYLRCQRIMPINACGGVKDHYEILLGVWDLNGGDISTPEFIEAAERYKRMPDVDRWVIKTAFHWITQHHQSLAERVDMFSINLSGRSLNDESFLPFILEQIRDSAVPVEKISFEVTETAGVANISDAVDFIHAIKETGCRFSLDDFGTGMSSYAYLKNLPVDYLKIDGAFVKDMVTNPSDYAVVKSICEIGHFMGKKVIAEFVENEEILEQLKQLGVDYAQGYGIEKPCTLADLIADQ
ncbi:MAG TPA: DUF1631 family protein [Gammaproteobacteria bacterium]|nr:DUF1631 family protein [Gammaproteobacteria bacterium]